ncbi:reverse transcriptase/maturase family protein [uncultured Caulobacter sp.]|uniref:reverse transcriptase/maturase family protein n=1 Tax=uncultured Caulobacter sp. TaxID=158749 RepID=UPI0026323998|nr:reverse transcriptase/maturase family protein [uncultured Caulobacter sp.]
MKRYGDLYGAVSSRAALYQGYYDARRGKRSSRACFQFERRLAAQVEDLHLKLAAGTYRPQRYHVFQIFEPKPRVISAPAFRDRVVQHAVYNVLRPIFDRTFIDQSFACRVGKGTHLASDYVQAALAKAPRDSYVLQLDIRRYYYRMDRAILRTLIERKIKDRRLVDLVMMFAEMTDEPVGVPIGNLLSQLFGLIYLDPLDHFIKRELKVRHYARYVDDFVLIGLTHDQAVDYRARIVAFLADRLRLELSHSSIHRVSRGLNFVGFRTWASARFVRKRALYSFRRAAKNGRLESVISSLGHAGKTGSRRAMFKHLRENHHGLYRRLPEGVRRLDHL